MSETIEDLMDEWADLDDILDAIPLHAIEDRRKIEAKIWIVRAKIKQLRG